MNPRRRAQVRIGALSAALVLGCGAHQQTERVFAGRTVSGPYIEPETYAAYADGAYLEARGEWARAEAAYRRALGDDADSPSIWTRLGVIACRTDLERALEAFRAATRQESFAPAWAAQARCLYDHHLSEQALASAKRAIMLDPTHADANLLVADIYRERARPASARAWLFAWLLLDPRALAHWKTLDRQAATLADPALASLLRAELERRARVGSEPEVAALDALAPKGPKPGKHPELEAAIVSGDLSAARLSASSAGISAMDLALLALGLGQPALASTQAELVLGADPGDGDAWIVALFAAALASDEDRFEELLHRGREPELPSAELAERVTELLRWWIDDDAAKDWAEAYRQKAAPPKR